MNKEQILAGSKAHPKPSELKFQYGTAGFRTRGDILDSVMYRVGLLASLRSRKVDGRTIGIMITASHNPAKDNGAKLVDPRGEMLEASWEKYATELANADDDEVFEVLESIIKTANINVSKSSSVVYAHDTRPSGKPLCQALQDGLEAAGTTVIKAEGLLTTPQLHYLVKCYNTKDTSDSYGVPTEDGYYRKLAQAFKTVCGHLPHPPELTVDCANGVGAPKLEKLVECSKEIGNLLPVKIVFNQIDDEAALNNGCGADFVKTNQNAPSGLGTLVPGELYCSLDGDADRIVFYYADGETFKLLDGDKIATLAAMFIKDLANAAKIQLEIGVVQTAYANGSSTNYIEKSLNVPVTCTPTGVKHLHHAAEEYDVGVYFEANGHGTILFSPEALSIIKSFEPESPAQKEAADTLFALSDLINQTVGDALSDMLLVVAILAHRQWKAKEWDSAYNDLPNKLIKVNVGDRSLFTTTDAERTLVTPEGLQGKINEIVEKYQSGRSFVRPSGTEDCVRVYAEAQTRTEAVELAYKVAGRVFDYAGAGQRPPEYL